MTLAEEKRAYDADGFLRLPGLFPPDRLAEIEANLADYLKTVVPSLPSRDVVFESSSPAGAEPAIRNLWRLERYSSYFEELTRAPELWSRMACMVNGEPIVWAVEVFAKPALVGSAVPFHQDNAYFNLIPPDALTCWIALDESPIENGCVHYLRGSHLAGLRPHVPSGVQGNSLKMADPSDQSQFEDVPAVLEPGDAILHHCEVWHRSEPNLSPKSRRGLLIVYRGAHSRVDPEGAQKYSETLKALLEGR